MDRQLDAEGYDVTDEPEGREARWPMVAVGAAAATVLAVSVGLVSFALSNDKGDHVEQAADATIVTALGHTVVGGEQAAAAALPTATAALDGTIGAPAGLPAGGVDQIPPRVLQSYRSAESTLATEAPACRLPWWLLAGIGKVESDHAAGGKVDGAGTATVRIVGPRLDGTAVGGGVVTDTDQGKLDGDLTFDRGVGPMLMVPQTWKAVGRDGNGDGTPDVANADDAALAVATVLCSPGKDLTTPDGLAAGIVALDDTAPFPADVLPWAAYYRTTQPVSPTASSTPGSASATPVPATSAPTTATPTPGSSTAPATPLPTPPVGPGFTTQAADAPASSAPPTVAPRPPAPPARPAPPRATPAPPRATPPPRVTPRPTPTRRPVTPAPTPTRAPAPTPRPTPGRPSPVRPSAPVITPSAPAAPKPVQTPAPSSPVEPSAGAPAPEPSRPND